MGYDYDTGDYTFRKGECYWSRDGIFQIDKDQVGSVKNTHHTSYITGRRLCSRTYKVHKKPSITQQYVGYLNSPIDITSYEKKAKEYADVLAVIARAVKANQDLEEQTEEKVAKDTITYDKIQD